MSNKISAPRGTADVLPAESWKWQTVERIARRLAELYHFAEIRTPIFEHTELFHRGVGEASDIVNKEMYTFEDRGGRSITLRPEGTAGVVRAAIEHSLIGQEGARAKVYYFGPNFRYERPQAGRLRIHHQFGVEAFGSAEPEQDVECILLQMDFYRDCKLQGLALRINTLGDRESKQRYREGLVTALSPVASQLSEESQRRLTENPLRILDSKDPRDIEAMHSVEIPASFQFLSDAARDHWDAVLQLLTKAKVKYNVDGNLVRGFDYYTNTLWEVTAENLGAQNALGGGGRYDNLAEQLGAKPTPGVGFGSGIERLLLALQKQDVSWSDQTPALVWIASQGEQARSRAFALLIDLRNSGIAADMDPASRSFKSQFKIADREKASFCVAIGDNEIASPEVTVKDLASRQEFSVPWDDLIADLKRRIASGAGHHGDFQ